MRKNSTLKAVFAYVIIIFLVIGINLICYFPLNKLEKSAAISKQNYVNKLNEIQSNDVTEQIKNINSEYIKQIQEHCNSFGKILTDMVLSLLVVTSLALVIFGLKFRVNTNKSKEIYNAVIMAGITCILYLIWFSININNAFISVF